MEFSELGNEFVLRGGQFLTPAGLVAGDIWVRDGNIQAVGTLSQELSNRTQRDLDGLYVLPGVIDVHVHPYTDGWAGTLKGGVRGGVTTTFFMLKYTPKQSFDDAFTEATQALRGQAVANYGFHLALREPLALDDIELAWRRGIKTFKLFMSHGDPWQILSDSSLFRALRAIAQLGGMALVHAESDALIKLHETEAQHRGDTLPESYLAAHSPITEVEAVSRALDFARLAECPLYFVHITTGEAVERIVKAQYSGQRVNCETCLPFLLLTSADLVRLGSVAKVAPALRDSEDVEAIWSALERGILDVVSSDHAPQSLQAKTSTSDIFRSPSGIPGTEYLLPLLYDEAVKRRGLPMELLGRVLAEMPSRLFGLYPQQGLLQPGCQADLIIFDPNQNWTVRSGEQHTQAGYTPYDGRKVCGRVLATFVRGKAVWDQEGEATALPGRFCRPVATPAELGVTK